MSSVTYRDLSGWLASGLPLSTPSNNVAKLFDAWQIQAHGYFDDPTLGGMQKTGKTILAEDPDFIFFDVMDAVQNSHAVQTTELKTLQVERMRRLHSISETRLSISGHKYSDWEVQHCKAALLYSQGQRKKGQSLWESILAEYPQDIIALSHVFLQGISDADFLRVRDTMLGSMVHFKKSDPFYGYMLARTGFTLEQTGYIRRAEEMIQESLQINPRDAWGIHSMAHVYDCEGRSKEGDRFMTECEADWRAGTGLAPHNWWHWALFQLDQGRTDDVLAMWEQNFLPSASNAMHDCFSYFQMSDAVSLLLRLENEFGLCGESLTSQWDSVIEKLMPAEISNTGQSFYDYHLTMAMAYAKRPDLLNTFRDNQKEYFSQQEAFSDYSIIANGIGTKVINAFDCISLNDYASAADILYDTKHFVWQTGGSVAQRDYWNHLLVNCLWRAGRQKDLARLKTFLNSRVMLRNRCGMSQRVSQYFIEEHAKQ